MSIHSHILKNEKIQNTKFRIPIRRAREKSSGFMWEGEKTIYLEDGREFRFILWHNFVMDDGSEDWEPDENELNNAWVCRFASYANEVFNTSGRILYFNNKIYVTKMDFFNDTNLKRKYLKQLKLNQISNNEINELFNYV